MFDKDEKLGCLAIIGLLIFAIVLEPLLVFWLGHFAGWLAELLIGGALCNALTTLIPGVIITPDMLPWIGGALAWIGSFFKSTSTSHSSK